MGSKQQEEGMAFFAFPKPYLQQGLLSMHKNPHTDLTRLEIRTL
jgi:hypothetical protein